MTNSDRLFVRKSGMWNGVPRQGWQIECDDCERVEFFADNSNRLAALSQAEKYFRKQGVRDMTTSERELSERLTAQMHRDARDALTGVPKRAL